MNQKLLSRMVLGLAVSSLCLFVAFFITSSAGALSIFDIQYPIPELGNCKDRADCKAFCDTDVNQNACFAFAQKFGLIKPEQKKQIEAADQSSMDDLSQIESDLQDLNASVDDNSSLGTIDEQSINDQIGNDQVHEQDSNNQQDVGEPQLPKDFIGPGGCTTKNICKNYCNSEAHQQECMDFAVNHGMMNRDDAEKALKLLKISKQGGPGGCKGADECRQFCSNPDNQDLCFQFAQQNGFIDKTDGLEQGDNQQNVDEQDMGDLNNQPSDEGSFDQSLFNGNSGDNGEKPNSNNRMFQKMTPQMPARRVFQQKMHGQNMPFQRFQGVEGTDGQDDNLNGGQNGDQNEGDLNNNEGQDNFEMPNQKMFNDSSNNSQNNNTEGNLPTSLLPHINNLVSNILQSL